MKFLHNLFVVCLALLVTACGQDPIFKEYEILHKIGDQPEWAAKNWNDADIKAKWL